MYLYCICVCVCAGEGKNLGCGSGSNRLRDVGTFCTISLDQEEVFRTKGKVHLEMKLNELITDNGPVSPRLQVRIIECQGLPLISGQNCDSFASVTLIGPSRSDQRKTKVKKKTSDPHFDETFYFEVSRSSSYTKKSHFQVEEEDIEKLEIKVELWNNGNLAQDVFLGETRVSLKILRNDLVHKACIIFTSLLYLSTKMLYLYPLEYYFYFTTPVSASAAHILGDVCRDRYEASLPVVRLLLHHNKLLPFLTAISALELENTQEANTIFRGNSLATRCIDDMMKMVGRSYLTITLKTVLDEICDSNKSCEIDPIKLKEGDNVEVNKENLQIYVQKVFSSITQSSASCPPLMCDVFRALRRLASDRFPGDPHVQYSAVSSFVFLRFFAVAVLSPHTFQLRPHHPTECLYFLTLFVCVCVCVCVCVLQSSFKETYMYDFFKLFQEDQCIEKVKKVRLLLLEIHKRAQGKKLLGKKNFKKRWLRITTRELSYHKHKGKDALCVIPVKNILGVEKLEENAFNRKNMFQVLLGERPLYVQAGNCVEASEWIEVLSQVSRCNPGRLSTFHPSAFVGGVWLCCKETTENLPGCRPCTTTLANIQLEIDCDRETERIFSLFSASLPRLQKMEDACAGMSVYLGQQKEQEEYSAFIIQDPKETFRTIKEIREVLEELKAQHTDKEKHTHTHILLSFLVLIFMLVTVQSNGCYQL
uniref:RAS p21 protein activator 2 n=1 Tax=Astyanax mexicanus TaxID=7994 RepID=A0A8B9L6K1_ASTMX